MEPVAYLERIGLNDRPAATLEGIERLQRAHVTTVPFENLAIVGDPFADRRKARWAATGVELSLPSLFEKIVEGERGGFCFELNGLFTWLLRELGVEADRLAARMVGEDGTGPPPANHHTVAIEFDRRYLVDVGVELHRCVASSRSMAKSSPIGPASPGASSKASAPTKATGS
ncbi:arylamine N-acetyltransferase [Halolamina sp.]|jgi:N-hydroxyarylamine O-acetyltransferase|uniref:arylamine N-acetyltransferase family protein n=1 Tax=Halolamina sp. TaxID=1940283 RepID=UPI000223B540|nr:N-acetyltransferase [halophilic archaeon DL31]